MSMGPWQGTLTDFLHATCVPQRSLADSVALAMRLIDACLHLQAADGVKRAQRGGMLTGAMLTAVASLLTGATRLQRGIISAAASSQEGGQITETSPIWPIYSPIKVSKPSIAQLQRHTDARNCCNIGLTLTCRRKADTIQLDSKEADARAKGRCSASRLLAAKCVNQRGLFTGVFRTGTSLLLKCELRVTMHALHLLQSLPAHQRIAADIAAAIGEDMQVRDSASEEVRRTRNRCRTIEGRLRSILKGTSGEVSEQVFCIH